MSWPLEIESHVAIAHADNGRDKFPSVVAEKLDLILRKPTIVQFVFPLLHSTLRSRYALLWSAYQSSTPEACVPLVNRRSETLKAFTTKTVFIESFQFRARLIAQLDLGTPAATQTHAAGKLFAAGFANYRPAEARRNYAQNSSDWTTHRFALASSAISSLARLNFKRDMRFSSASSTSISSPRKFKCSPWRGTLPF